LEEDSTLPLASGLVDFQKFDYVVAWGEKKTSLQIYIKKLVTLEKIGLWQKCVRILLA
jgi:hypothetical protein